MNMQRSIRLSLAGAVALALFGTTGIAMAQTPPPPPPQQQQPMTPPPPQQPMPPPPPQEPMPPQQPMPPPPPQEPMPPQQSIPPSQPMPPPESQATRAPSGQFYQGTESTARYPLAGSNGGSLIVHAGMPAEVQQYGPPPSFSSLDANHDGRISEEEARAYPPLESDFLFASGQARTVSKAQYKKWVDSQFGQQ